jgi:uncharacterized protein YdeI (YjbR/CyaY-like superfamily)
MTAVALVLIFWLGSRVDFAARLQPCADRKERAVSEERHPKDDLPILPFASPSDWEAWLADRHVTANGIWLKLAKAASGIASVTYAEALDVALCYGWIDGQKAPFDDRYWLQRFTPRRARSKWSKVNREKVEALIAAGRMQPAGLCEIERAKADGRWNAAYDSQRTMTIPDDLQQVLDANPHAAAFFAGLTGANRYAILYRIHDAKRPETRQRRIEQFIQMLAEGRALY